MLAASTLLLLEQPFVSYPGRNEVARKRRPESWLTRGHPEMTMKQTCPPAIPSRITSCPQEMSAMKKCLSSYIVLLSLFVVSSAVPPAQADVTLPKVIGDHMVLQRDRPLPIWGWAAPDEEIKVKLDDAMANAKADAHGNWKVVLPAMKADGKAHTMTVSGKNKIELDDILIGEVWIGSGQSNMEMGIKMCDKAEKEIAAANYPKIRLLLVPKVQTGQPAKDVNGKWVQCTPKTVAAGGWGGFSAALYYFGRDCTRN